jgi:hypothetical protein
MVAILLFTTLTFLDFLNATYFTSGTGFKSRKPSDL